MSISSIGTNWLLYSSYLTTLNTNTSQSSSTVSELQNLLSNADGDTLELSAGTQNISSNYMSYGPPPPRGQNGPEPAPSPEIKEFLDKIANGTATDEDLENMQSVLQEAQQQFSSNQVDDSDPIKSFLDKVANGTVTDEDLQNMQSILQEMQQQMGNNGSESGSLNFTDSLDATNADSTLKSFLDKVANGTVTDDDLKDMQSLLQEMQQEYLNGLAGNTNSNFEILMAQYAFSKF